MKKHSFLFIAGALLTLASCQSDTNDNGANQAQIDSTVNARVEEMRLQMMAQNDSIINAEAQRRADSMFAEMKGGSASITAAPKTTRPATTKPTTSTGSTKQTVESGGLRSQSDQNRSKDKSTVEGGGLRSQSDQNRLQDNKAVEKGGLRSQSDQNRRK